MTFEYVRGDDRSAVAYLVEGRVLGNATALVVDLFVELWDGRTQLSKVLVSRKGRIQEVVRLPTLVRSIRLGGKREGASLQAQQLVVRRLSTLEYRLRQFWRASRALAREPASKCKRMGLTFSAIFRDLDHAYEIACRFRANVRTGQYEEWHEEFYGLTSGDRVAMRAALAAWPHRPTFRVTMLCRSSENSFDIEATRSSLRTQTYPYFEVHEQADTPADPAEIFGLADCADIWHIAIRPGTRLAEQALFCLADAILKKPAAAVVYADHDFIQPDGRLHSPVFKPDWSPELLRAINYIGEAFAWNGRYVSRTAFDAAPTCADMLHRLLLDLTATGQPVVHVPAPLWHVAAPVWEQHTADVVRSHLQQLNIEATVVDTAPACCRVQYRVTQPAPLVSIIVPTRDGLVHLRRCIDSIIRKTIYAPYEILVVDNQSALPETLAYFEEIRKLPFVRVLPFDKAFNYSAINNMAVSHADGPLICLLNNDTEVISPDWLGEMVGQLLRDDVGVVGAKLLYGDGRVQHAGDTVGPGGCANHLHVGIGRDDPGYAGRARVAQDLSAVTAACLLTKKDLYQQLGGLNERRLKVAFNDVDYCLKVREAGMRVIWTPHALLYHHESATRGKDESYAQIRRAKAEIRYMRKRWAHVMENDPFYNINLNYLQADFALSSMPTVSHPWRYPGKSLVAKGSRARGRLL